jgi:hypothetical protein
MDLMNPSLATSWKRFRRRYLRPWRTVRYGDLRVHYKKHLDGGGSWFGQEYIPFLQARGMPKQQRAFEWCSGPAFIGFSLLANGLCETLCVADINDQAVEACRRTVRTNRLSDRVSVYESDNLNNIPSAIRPSIQGRMNGKSVRTTRIGTFTAASSPMSGGFSNPAGSFSCRRPMTLRRRRPSKT